MLSQIGKMLLNYIVHLSSPQFKMVLEGKPPDANRSKIDRGIHRSNQAVNPVLNIWHESQMDMVLISYYIGHNIHG